MAGRSLISGNNRATLAERKDDLYETPPEAVHALLTVETIPQTVWECACGPGSIVRTLRGAGREVWATDLVDYGLEDSESAIDFLMERKPTRSFDGIVTNPPYKLASAFIDHACSLSPYVAMLLRLEFIAGSRRGLLERNQPARIYVFSNRLPRMHRAGWTGPRSSSRLSFAWFIWDRTHSGPTELRRLSWESAE